ncbi:MAG: hypothetical protein IT454_16315 [Planctomycetes bacterium]|nr:hypothetical protein [Planctomycetota bacterium]
MKQRLLLVSTLLVWPTAACTLHEPAPVVALLDSAGLERAELLVGRLRCAACHGDDSGAVPLEPAPSLESVGARKTPAGLRRWLEDPRQAKPGTAMPHLLAHLTPDQRERTVDELVHYLAAQGGPLTPVELAVQPAEIERGRQLFHSVGCVACHAPQESADDIERPLWSFERDEMLVPQVAADLGNPAFETTLDALAAFLEDPLSARPSGRMPSLSLEHGEAQAIATYLLRGQIAPEGLEIEPGLAWRAFEGQFASCEPGFGGATPTAQGVALDFARLPPHPEDHFGFEFSGFVTLEHTGQHTFWTRSDDGSRLYVDGKLVVENDGDHAPQERSGEVWLERGPHQLLVTMYENAGGEELSVSWKSPRGQKQPLPAQALSHGRARYTPRREPFALERAKVERGRRAFAELGCGACHAIEGRAEERRSMRTLAQVSRALDRGCLADDPAQDAPHFDLDAPTRELLRAYFASVAVGGVARDPRRELHATLSRLDCFACHRRNGEGGPNETRLPYFRASREVDLGNEGRLPPHLDHTGEKLRTEWIARVLTEGASARPYLATRMPRFGAHNVGSLATLFERVDCPGEPPADPVFDPTQVELGRRLAGAKGLGCIQCHLFNGVDSLGIPAVDLAHVRERIRVPWFKRLILDPKSVGMNSRMPELWQTEETVSGKRVRSPVADVLDGDPQRQVEALWQYLALGSSMPPPEGLLVPEAEFELIPRDEPLLCAVFLAGHTPRGMLVGYPEQVHFAYDLEHSRPVWAWRGRFFNAEGTWHGRAGGLERPPSASAFEFPAGCALRVQGAEALPKRLGWKLDGARRPVFEFELAGARVEEHFEPVLRPGGASLRRNVVVRWRGALSAAPTFEFGDGEPLRFESQGDGLVARHGWEVSW